VRDEVSGRVVRKKPPAVQPLTAKYSSMAKEMSEIDDILGPDTVRCQCVCV
jgi:hypothetical protein